MVLFHTIVLQQITLKNGKPVIKHVSRLNLFSMKIVSNYSPKRIFLTNCATDFSMLVST